MNRIINQIDRTHRNQIEDTAQHVWEMVLACLAHKFPEHYETIQFRIMHCDYDDMPWTIRLGEVRGACLDIDGFDVSHLMFRFKTFGLAMVKTRFAMGAKS